ncbi:MAG: cyclase family protein [Deltaproteobacteria bacterium]|nr:cyclase family protein [Deltaproteobacteria bacterium]
MSKSEWIDISLPIRKGMLVGPHDPPVDIWLVRDPDKGAPVTMSQISMITHAGTHIDAPAHFFRGGATIDAVPLDTFMGPARIIEIRDEESINVKELEPYNIQAGERILFKTKNSSWAYDTDDFATGYVYIATETAHYLAEKRVRLVGIDYITVGGFEDPEGNREVHRIFLKNGISILELINLSGVEAGEYEINAVPLRIEKGDAGPCRALVRRLK